MTFLTENTSGGVPLRLEARQSIVHVVEYSRYPRRLASENLRVAYTQDRSETGLGLDLPERVTSTFAGQRSHDRARGVVSFGARSDRRARRHGEPEFTVPRLGPGMT